MTLLLIRQVRHNSPFRSPAPTDHLQKTPEKSPLQTAKNDAKVAKISVHRPIQERERTFCSKYVVSRGRRSRSSIPPNIYVGMRSVSLGIGANRSDAKPDHS